MATDSADLRQMWWSMAEVCVAGGREKSQCHYSSTTPIL